MQSQSSQAVLDTLKRQLRLLYGDRQGDCPPEEAVCVFACALRLATCIYLMSWSEQCRTWARI